MTLGNRPKILCVDDESAMLDALERALRRSFTVLKATSGQAALELLRQNVDTAVLLSDQRMPGMTGLEFLNMARQIVPDAVRAILSGQMDLSDMVEAVNSTQIHRFILKPWDNDYLHLQMTEAHTNHLLLQEKSWLERLSITDPVTQLANHRFFQDHLRTEFERAQRHQRPLSLVMIDLDHFKAFNDRHGHPAGDRLLALAAHRVQSQVRSIDRVSRYGGDEFALIMPDTDASDALRVADRIRTAFVSRGFDNLDGSPVSVTISLGIASCPRHATGAQYLIEAADQALYQAKGQGRNQSVVAAERSLLT